MEETKRNQPCSCGSGKKYKYCCSPSAINILGDEIALFQRNRNIAYTGELGARREEFCRSYMIKKAEIFRELSEKQNEMAASEKGVISCAKGCTHCCILMVGATIQEVELIVHYLYQNEELFNYFIDIYPKWISKLGEVDCLLDKQSKNKSVHSTASVKEKSHYNCCYMLSASLDMKWKSGLESRLTIIKEGLYCPFLRDGECSIHEVRPYYCAGYFAITPQDWCNPLNAAEYRKRKASQTFKIDLADDLSFYGGNLEKPVWSFMPVMVYETLKYGTEALHPMKIIEGSAMKSYVLREAL
jgi:Fe-S-cluster containining protein